MNETWIIFTLWGVIIIALIVVLVRFFKDTKSNDDYFENEDYIIDDLYFMPKRDHHDSL